MLGKSEPKMVVDVKFALNKSKQKLKTPKNDAPNDRHLEGVIEWTCIAGVALFFGPQKWLVCHERGVRKHPRGNRKKQTTSRWFCWWPFLGMVTLQEINISHRGKGKIIFKYALNVNWPPKNRESKRSRIESPGWNNLSLVLAFGPSWASWYFLPSATWELGDGDQKSRCPTFILVFRNPAI